MVLTLTITQQDIDTARDRINNGTGFRSTCCPVATAITRELLPGMVVQVTGDAAFIYLGDPLLTSSDSDSCELLCDFGLPADVVAFVDAFDENWLELRGSQAQPATFEVEL